MRFVSPQVIYFVGVLARAEAVRVTVAEQQTAGLPIVVGREATRETNESAAKLADYLQRITGAKFEVRVGDGSTGIAVGRDVDFPGVKHGVKFRPNETTRREEYLLRPHADGVWLIGATDLAATRSFMR